jgi:tetratricopeptide (TPR) repeat protein
MRRLVLFGTVAALAAAVLLLGGVAREATEPAAAGSGPSTDELVAHAFDLQQRWRETADPSNLTRSEAALRRVLQLEPGNAQAVFGLASVALSRHQFRNALELARRARALDPGWAAPLGAVGDALLELGRYEQAFDVFDRFAERGPGLAAYSRIAYGRELIGRPRAAIAAMQMASDAAPLRGEPAAWPHVELGKLHFGLGELRAAARQFRLALAAEPGFPSALDGLARVDGALGKMRAALALSRRAVDTVPLPQYVSTLTDLYLVAGRAAEAQRQLRLVGAIERLLAANGVRTDLETAVFDADHGLRLADALTRARRAYAERPSIDAADALAWALVRNGRCAEALTYTRRALSLGTLDALKLFHRGMAERCAGRAAAGRQSFRRALALNPYFSLRFAPLAERLAR